MKDLKSIILNNIQPDDDPMVPIRGKYVGYPIDEKKLIQWQYTKKNKVKCWEKKYHNNKYRVRLFISEDGILTNIRCATNDIGLIFASNYDTFDFYNKFFKSSRTMNWIMYKPTPEIVNEVQEILSSLVIVPTTSNLTKEAESLLKRVEKYNFESYDNNYPVEIYLSAVAETIMPYDHENALILLMSCLRHSDNAHRYQLMDAPFLYKHLYLHGECINTIRTVMERVDIDLLTANGITNIGNCLCDYLHKPLEAFECFKHAISIDPDLIQPRQNIWIAGKKIIEHHLKARSFADGVKVYEEACEIGTGYYTLKGHGLWS